jgi:tetratricopeptide (TPR) repeat protein
MMKLLNTDPVESDELFLAPPSHQSAPITLPTVLGSEASNQLMRMFRDPRILEPDERANLISQLRKAADIAPQIVEVRVLLGMALCVDLQVQDALEELREAARMEPDSFIARLKFGELLMRLRICEQAAEETHKAALLASNTAQSELARKQAAAIRTMLREGIERGGYGGLISRLFRFRRNSKQGNNTPVLVGSK